MRRFAVIKVPYEDNGTPINDWGYHLRMGDVDAEPDAEHDVTVIADVPLGTPFSVAVVTTDSHDPAEQQRRTIEREAS